MTVIGAQWKAWYMFDQIGATQKVGENWWATHFLQAWQTSFTRIHKAHEGQETSHGAVPWPRLCDYEFCLAPVYFVFCVFLFNLLCTGFFHIYLCCPRRRRVDLFSFSSRRAPALEFFIDQRHPLHALLPWLICERLLVQNTEKSRNVTEILN